MLLMIAIIREMKKMGGVKNREKVISWKKTRLSSFFSSLCVESDIFLGYSDPG